MFYVISQIVKGVHYQWARIISENLNMQLRSVQDTKKFTMTLCLVYLYVGKNKYKGMSYKGFLSKDRIFDVYPQLLFNTSNYRRVNDAFLMYITRILQDSLHVRISLEAMDLIKMYGY